MAPVVLLRRRKEGLRPERSIGADRHPAPYKCGDRRAVGLALEQPDVVVLSVSRARVVITATKTSNTNVEEGGSETSRCASSAINPGAV